MPTFDLTWWAKVVIFILVHIVQNHVKWSLVWVCILLPPLRYPLYQINEKHLALKSQNTHTVLCCNMGQNNKKTLRGQGATAHIMTVVISKVIWKSWLHWTPPRSIHNVKCKFKHFSLSSRKENNDKASLSLPLSLSMKNLSAKPNKASPDGVCPASQENEFVKWCLWLLVVKEKNSDKNMWPARPTIFTIAQHADTALKKPLFSYCKWSERAEDQPNAYLEGYQNCSNCGSSDMSLVDITSEINNMNLSLTKN